MSGTHGPQPEAGAPGPSADDVVPAATVALLRDAPGGPEVLLTRRPATMAFGPGLHVFPGGRLDAADEDPRLLERLATPLGGDPAGLHGPAFAIAAIREAWEEAGILLASDRRPASGPAPHAAGRVADARAGGRFVDLVLARDLELRGDWLMPLSRWVTPPVVPRRYDTRFFVAWLPDGATPAFDAREVDAHEWLTPDAALEAMADGRIELWPPTATTLQQLLPVRRREDAGTLVPVRPQAAPVVEHVDGTDGLVTRIVLHGAGGVPGAVCAAYVVGRRRVAIVDPGDPNDEAAEAILGVVAGRHATVDAVLVTRATPDRAAGAEGLALRLGVPVLAPDPARRRLAGTTRALLPGEVAKAGDLPIRALDAVGGLAYAVETAGVVLTGGAAGIVLTGGADGPWPAGLIPLS
jgi:8-oxo-dGTP pyrophosphatase MutT (NUDIX family)